MYAAFNLSLQGYDSKNFIRNHGIPKKDIINKKTQKKLDDLILNNGSLSAEEMRNEWFPNIDTNIFISHSHQDEDLAIALSNYLEKTFGIKSFIDSTVWGYAGDLQKQIDDKYCYNEFSRTYCYKKRNFSTSHVHMILTMALAMMIDKSEIVIFLNTPKSINTKDILTGFEYETTNSPWIFSELSLTSIIEKKDPSKHRIYPAFESASESLQKSIPSISYRAALDHLIELNIDDFVVWQAKKKNIDPYENMDLLYKLKIN